MNIRKFSSLDYIGGLDGMRAIAVLLVILHHYLMPFDSFIAQGFFGKLIIMLAKIGWVGVDMFFVISGFLITKILIQHPINSLQAYRRFLTARIWRLIPAYLFCLIMFSAIALWFAPQSKVLANSVSLWTLSSNIQSSFINRTALMDNQFNLVHFWSLALEWHFYIIFPMLIWVFRAYWLVGLVLLLVGLLSRFIFQQAGLSDNAIYAFTLCRFDAFAMGIFLAIWLPKLKYQHINYLAIFGLITFVTSLLLIGFDTTSFKKIVWLQSYGYTLIALGFALLLGPIITGQAKKILNILESKVMVGIGRRSYSLYIWHLVFFPFVIQAIISFRLQPFYSVILILLIATLISLLLSTISYQFIETKCYQLFKESIKQGG